MSVLSQLDAVLPPDPSSVSATRPRLVDITRLSIPSLPAHLLRMVQELPAADRSGRQLALVAGAVEWGLSDAEIHALAAQHVPSTEKYQGRLPREVDRVLDKHRPLHQHVGQPCDVAGCPNRPRWMTNTSVALDPRTAASADLTAVASAVSPPPVDVEGFWQARPFLRHLHCFARARMVSPWALLGVQVVRVLAVVPPNVVLPAIVGSQASLNTFVALVGPSGNGKGAAESAAPDALDVGEVEVHTAGSGEGLAHLYAHRQGQQVVRLRESVVLSVPEVDTLTALRSRQGSTLMPALRSAWSGEKLGFAYANPEKALPIEPHSYRLGLILGVQPGRAAPLLDDADGGTPQRFLWLPTTDPHATDQPPPTPPIRTVAVQGWRSAGRHELVVPDIAVQAVRSARLASLRGEVTPLDGHGLLTRLKLTQALALLDNRKDMTADDWHLAGVVLVMSDHARTLVQSELAAQARTANAARARFEGERAVIAQDVADDHAVQRCARSIVKHLKDGSTARSSLRKRLASRDRAYFDDALERLVAVGQVQLQPTDHGHRVALVDHGS